MGFIEEGRQLIQDFVTPEIRAIEARLDAIEKQVASLDAKTDKLDSKIDRNQAHMEAKIDRNQAHMEAKIDHNQAHSLEGKIDRNQAQVLGHAAPDGKLHASDGTFGAARKQASKCCVGPRQSATSCRKSKFVRGS